MENQQNDQTLNKILVIVQDLQVQMGGMITKDEFSEFKTEIYNHIDGFVRLHETLDLELVSLRSKYERLEERLEMVERKVGLAAA